MSQETENPPDLRPLPLPRPEHFRYEERARVGVITLSRPDRFNALTFAAYRELTDLFHVIDRRSLAPEGARALVLQGAAATWPGVVAAGLDTFGVIHIASHAEIHHGTGRRSTLRLVTGEGSRPVTMTEVARLGLEAELVFLSSCRSGQPLSAPVAGPDDFTEAFLAAGAHAVIASTSWADDTAARRLADSFYRHWRAGASRAAALQQARKDVQRDHPHPSYWAFTRLVARSD